MNLYLLYLISLPKSIYFNFRCLAWQQAIHLPILVHWRTKFVSLRRNSIEIEGNIKPFMVKLGLGGTPKVMARRTVISSEGKLVFHGRVAFGRGILLSNRGTMHIGKDINSNPNISISCMDAITIGDHTMIGSDITIRDNDGHQVITDGKEQEMSKPVVIGDHVWLCDKVVVLKGAAIAEGSIAAFQSVITKAFHEPHVLIAGIPGKIVKRNVDWKH